MLKRRKDEGLFLSKVSMFGMEWLVVINIFC